MLIQPIHFIAIFISFHIFSLWQMNLMGQSIEVGGISTNTQAEDTLKVNLLNKTARGLMFNNPDSGIIYGEQAYNLAVGLGFKRGQIDALHTIGSSLYVKSNYGEALKAYTQVKNLSEAIEYKEGIAKGENSIGLIYMAQKKYAQSVKYFHNAIHHYQILDDPHGLAGSSLNIAISYDEAGNLDSAYKYITQAARLSPRLDREHLKQQINNWQGEILLHKGDYQNALTFYKRVLSDSLKGFQWEKCFAFAGLAQAHLMLDHPKEALRPALQSLSIAQELNAVWDQEKAYRILSEVYAALGLHEKAYDVHIRYKEISDSLYSTETEREMNFLHLQNQQVKNAQLLQQNEIQAHKLKLNRLITFTVGLAAFFILLFAIFAFRGYRQNQKLNTALKISREDILLQKQKIADQNKELTEMNAAKDRMFSVISHDLNSPFVSILSSLELMRAGALEEEEKDFITENLYKQVSTVHEMVLNLLQWSGSQLMGIKTYPVEVVVPTMVDEVLGIVSFPASEKEIDLIHEKPGSGNLTVVADQDHLKIILQNLLSNAVKFTPKGGEVVVRYEVKKQQATIIVSDTGVGMTTDKIQKLFNTMGKDISERGTGNEGGTGLGLILVEQFVKANHGELGISSAPRTGTDFKITFPTV